MRAREPDHGDAAGPTLDAGDVGIGLGDPEAPAGVELVVGDEVQHVEPGEGEPLSDTRADACPPGGRPQRIQHKPRHAFRYGSSGARRPPPKSVPRVSTIMSDQGRA